MSALHLYLRKSGYSRGLNDCSGPPLPKTLWYLMPQIYQNDIGNYLGSCIRRSSDFHRIPDLDRYLMELLVDARKPPELSKAPAVSTCSCFGAPRTEIVPTLECYMTYFGPSWSPRERISDAPMSQDAEAVA